MADASAKTTAETRGNNGSEPVKGQKASIHRSQTRMPAELEMPPVDDKEYQMYRENTDLREPFWQVPFHPTPCRL
jgi:hypothetical protein